MKHLVFFDGACGLCDHSVQFLLRVDRKKVFQFTRLQGETAKKLLTELPKEVMDEDSLILIENFHSNEQKVYLMGKAWLRICWLLGGWFSFIGWMSFLPSWPFDQLYRVVARNRSRFFSKESCRISNENDRERFLP